MSAVASNWDVLEETGPQPSGGRIVGVANQKGGVGKTTSAINLGAGLALRGHRILVVDCDPQSNATTGMGIDHRELAASTYDLLLGEVPLETVTVPTTVEGLFCAPATPDLAGAEIELVAAERREHRLAAALEEAVSAYDVVLVDCPPSLGLLTVNALVAAHELIVPVQCEYYALEGLGQLLGTAERVRARLNPRLRITGFLLTMYDARTKLSSQVADEVRDHFGALVYRTVVPRSVRLSEAPSFGEPVLTLDPTARGSIAYKLLAAEVEGRYGLGPEPVAHHPTRPPVAQARPGRHGPAGRGFGTVAPAPPDLDRAWPRPSPWRVRS